MKPVIAIDIDDVLADYAQGFIDFTNRHWGTNLTVDDYDEHWINVWKVDIEEVRRRAEKIHDLSLVKNLTHNPSAGPVLDRLSQRFKLIVVTSRRIQNREDTLAWMKQHYPMIASEEITFNGFFDTITDQSIHMTKGKIASDLGAAYLIDDQPKHCLSAAEHGVEALLFGDYGWNQLDDIPQGVTRVKDWAAVEAYFSGSF